MIRLLDAIGLWIAHAFGSVQAQVRLGVALTLLSIPIAAYGPFSGEQLWIYEMSALALILTGVCIVIAALPSDPDDTSLEP